MGVTDTMGSGGAPGISFDTVGQEIEGVVVDIDETQERDFKTKQPVFWPDGAPKMVPIFTLQTSLRDSDEDDGLRTVWCRNNIYTAVGKALREAFKPGKPSDEAVVGGTLKVRFHATEKTDKGSPRKIFIAKFTRKQVTQQLNGQAPADAQHDERNPPPPADW